MATASTASRFTLVVRFVVRSSISFPVHRRCLASSAGTLIKIYGGHRWMTFPIAIVEIALCPYVNTQYHPSVAGGSMPNVSDKTRRSSNKFNNDRVNADLIVKTSSQQKRIFTPRNSIIPDDDDVDVEDHEDVFGRPIGESQIQDLDVGDTFGLLGGTHGLRLAEDEEGDEGDKREEAYLSGRTNTRYPVVWYGRQVLKLVKKNQLTEALDFFKHMLEVDRVKPDSFVYSNLIGGCGRAGYTKMAFKLYKQMKERGLKIPAAVYTGLFNACGNSPWPEDGLRRARRLLSAIEEKAILLNKTNYHAAIKAFGRCNDLRMALQLVDEMVTKQVIVSTETFNFLLMACSSDKEQGFLRAIQVWRKMREKRIKPDIYSFNLLIRAVRDCGLGDPEVAGNLLLITDNDQRCEDRSMKLIDDSSNESSVIQLQPWSLEVPDMLSPVLNSNRIVSLTSAETAQDRLFMLGGSSGIFKRMEDYQVKPELKTLTELIEIVPASDEAFVIDVMDENKVAADVDFFNVLIKKRCLSKNFNDAKDVLKLIAQRNIHVDIATFGALSTGCTYWSQAKALLEDMDTNGFRPNTKIMGSLIKLACKSLNFWYLLDMLNRLKENDIKVDTQMLKDIEFCIMDAKKFIVKREKAGKKSRIAHLENAFKTFIMAYANFLKTNEVEMPLHPWKVFEAKEITEETDSAKS